MGGGPAVREQLLKALVIRLDAEEKVAHVGPGFDTMTLGPCKNRIQHGGSRSRRFTAQEEPVFSAHGLVAQRPLAYVVVDRQATVFGVATQSRPLVTCTGYVHRLRA